MPVHLALPRAQLLLQRVVLQSQLLLAVLGGVVQVGRDLIRGGVRWQGAWVWVGIKVSVCVCVVNGGAESAALVIVKPLHKLLGFS